jgi:hypothetical protein
VKRPVPVLWIRVISMGIRFQNLMTKNWEIFLAGKKYGTLRYIYLLASIKDIQAKAEASSPQKRTSNALNHDISFF